MLGAGPVGLSTALVLACAGHRLRVVERDPGRVRALRRGRVPYPEPGLEDLLRRLAGRVAVTPDPAAAAGARVLVVAVGTSHPRPEARVRAVHAAVTATLAACGADPPQAVVVRATLPPGGTRRLAAALAAAGRPLPVAYVPEFLRGGQALADAAYPDRLVVGADDPAAAEAALALFRPLLAGSLRPRPLPPPGGYRPPQPRLLGSVEAELVKLATNALLAVKVSFAAELAALCDAWGADAGAVAEGVGLDPRLGAGHLRPGLGWGGPCLPADAAALRAAARSAGLDLAVLAAAQRVNRALPSRAARRLEEALGGLAGRTVAVLGLAFKPGVADARRSPAAALVRRLLRRGARVRIHDPGWPPGALPAPAGAEAAPDPYAAAEGADAVVLATAWPQYAELDLARLAAVMRGRWLVDAPRAWPPAAVRRAGLRPLGVGT